jgi:GNAT superfamily N-acetyltransferase
MLAIIEARTPEQIQQFQGLVAEYMAWDIEMSRRAGLSADTLVDFDYQHGADEHLAEFAPPDGRLLLANFDGQVGGCAGLRRLSPEIGEIKRVYVRPAFRGKGLGTALIEAVIAAARLIGYRKLRLETAGFMEGAQALYRSLGFNLIEPYREVPAELKPVEVFMELNLE